MSETASRTDADFEAFYERHWKYVYRLCFSYLQNEADAEDVTEDIFVKVLTGDCVFRDLTHERKWLCICAINLCKDRLKRFDRSRVDSLDDDAMPEIAAPEKKDYPEVRDAVMCLPAELKDVILLYYYAGYRTGEIAKLLDRPPSTVRNQLRDARNHLRSMLGGYSQ